MNMYEGHHTGLNDPNELHSRARFRFHRGLLAHLLQLPLLRVMRPRSRRSSEKQTGMTRETFLNQLAQTSAKSTITASDPQMMDKAFLEFRGIRENDP